MMQRIWCDFWKFFFYFKREGAVGLLKRVYRGVAPDLNYINWKKKYKVAEYAKEKRLIVEKKIKILDVGSDVDVFNITLDSDVEYVLLKSSYVSLLPNALSEFVTKAIQIPEAGMIYSDHETNQELPVFKPDYNYDLLLDYNYIGKIILVRRDVFEAVRAQLDSQVTDIYEIILRTVEKTNRIEHISKVLYCDETQQCMERKTISRIFIEEHLERMGYNSIVNQGGIPGSNHIQYKIENEPMISILIPNKDHADDLRRCIQSIHKQDYSNYEIIIIENHSIDAELFAYYKQLMAEYDHIRIIKWDKEFNYSAINNYAASHAKGEYYLLLNNDVEFISEHSIWEMIGLCSRRDVGAVGIKLLYPDRSIQHAGIVVGYGGIAGHAFLNEPSSSDGYMGRINRVQDYSAVTAACMLVKQSIYKEVGGFDVAYKIAFNDVDFCLKIIEKGYRIVYTPYADAFHYESKTRGSENDYKKIKRFNQEVDLLRKRWGDFIKKGDPSYNENLTLYKWDFSLKK